MHRVRALAIGTLTLLTSYVLAWGQVGDVTVFAVVSDSPKDKMRIAAKTLVDGTVSDMKLIPADSVLGNPVWRTLEICHALKLEGVKLSDGFKVSSARVLDASMLPMALQGFAGDCLIKKAVEIAPLAD
ncbi:MAG TPA: hypothetical protein VM842_05425 [Nitrospira sp.]|jgi:hypothetical protein|nr:hypothetical protein [Nitrospira sp.]